MVGRMTPGARPVGVLLSAMLVTASILTGGGPRAAALPGGAQAAIPGGQRVPEPGSGSELDGVFCTSPASCWAVGGYSPPAGNIELNEALRWNGRTWSQVFVPNPPGSMGGGGSVLRKVRCLSAANCWAVGLQVRRETELNEALHWNGRRWSLVPVPQPGGTVSGDSSQLFDVACGSPTSCWAVGDYHTGATFTTASLNELLHWNGRRWSLVSVPDPGGAATDDANVLESVRCTSARSCLAVGTHNLPGRPSVVLNEVLRWNGRTWSLVATPDPGGVAAAGDFSQLLGLTCASARDCWAAGTYGGQIPAVTFLNEILHWNGRKWSQVIAPNPVGGSGSIQVLYAAACSSATSCWAVGWDTPRDPNSGFALNQAIHWNGRRWTLVPAPDPGGTSRDDVNQLQAVQCSSAARCWAVGFGEPFGASRLAVALRWNGTRWSPR
jgi:hypothetical protein